MISLEIDFWFGLLKVPHFGYAALEVPGEGCACPSFSAGARKVRTGIQSQVPTLRPSSSPLPPQGQAGPVRVSLALYDLYCQHLDPLDAQAEVLQGMARQA